MRLLWQTLRAVASTWEQPHGIASHDTFGDGFARLDPAQWQNCFVSWTPAIAELLPGEVVAIAG